MGPQLTFGPAPRKEIVFPAGSVEAVVPLPVARKRLSKSDVSPVDPWRIFMSLKSGLLAESTWALDTLNALLFDDSTVVYFGLQHLPGLLDILLDHFRRPLMELFGICYDLEVNFRFLPHKLERSVLDLRNEGQNHIINLIIWLDSLSNINFVN